MTDTPVRLSLTLDRNLVKGLAVSSAAGVVLAFTGAFGMTGAGFLARLLYWLPLMLIGAAWGHVCSRIVERWIDFDRKPWLGALVLTAAMSLPLTLFVWAYTVWIFEGGRFATLDRLVMFLLPVTVVTGVLSVLNIFLQRTPVQTHAAPAGSAPARFLDRLPPKLRGATLRAVESEDHYLRLHTDRGSDLILMRLSDALSELEGLEGAQTHRSWWVARQSVRDVSRGEGRATLTLEGGIEAPVSRRYAKALRDAGWY